MRLDSVCESAFPPVFGFDPATLESIAPTYLGSGASRDRYADYRARRRFS